VARWAQENDFLFRRTVLKPAQCFTFQILRNYPTGMTLKVCMTADNDDNRDIFTRIYMQNTWGGRVSRSGTGSEGDFATQKIGLLRNLIEQLEISSILDIGCGDMYWMRDVISVQGSRPILRYLGIDVVPDVIAVNQRSYGTEHARFLAGDLTQPGRDAALDLRLTAEPWDLVMVLDVFGHLINAEVDAMLDCLFNRCRARYLLVTNRRGAGAYLTREKSRLEGIDVSLHPHFIQRRPATVRSFPALFPGDFFDVYDLAPPATEPQEPAKV
jgi:hypothetical protein